MRFDDSPQTLHPFVGMSAPNVPLPIRDGDFEIRSERFSIHGQGRLELRWFPQLHLMAEIETAHEGPFDIGELEAVTLADAGASLEHAEIIRSASRTKGTDFGVHALGVEFGTSDALDGLTLHLVNLPRVGGAYVRDSESTRIWAGRVELVVQGWRFTLDTLANHKETTEELRTQGGYAITHTCLLTREDEGTFAYKDAIPALSGLAFLLALFRGAWSEAVVLVGTSRGSKVWERWEALTRNDAWTGSVSWWHPTTRNIFDELAGPVFEAVVGNEDSAARYAITWYTEAKRAERSVESPLIMSQTALELLAWHMAVRRDNAFTPEGFDRLRAEDQLRYLFSLARLDTSFPDVYPELRQYAKAHGWNDIAHAICHVRNSVVHPPRRQGPIERIPVEIRIDVSRLAIWALELCLLYLFDYQGDYANRHRDFHPPERVPWSRGGPGGAHPPWSTDHDQGRAMS